MTPLLLFLLGVAAVYVGTVTAAFSTLMRLSLRLQAERSGRDDLLGLYLDEPLRLFIPARLLQAFFPAVAVLMLARVTGVDFGRGLPILLLSGLIFVLFCEHLVPLALVRRDPERILDILLPSFHTVARALVPVTAALMRVGMPRRDRQSQLGEGESPEPSTSNGKHEQAEEEPRQQEDQARRLLRSIADFRETMVREVMTPRPDIVAISAHATLGELHTKFREQQYSRMPVYNETLDNIQGFIFVKDLILLTSAPADQGIAALVRPAYFVPETKRVPELLREFQRNRVQIAIVVDEYGGTAGLVALEDLLEEIVGEIRDEYDTEVEPVVDEGAGIFVFNGKTHVEELAERLKVDVQGEGFETVGGFLLSHLGRVPQVGETFEVDGLAVEVLEAERRRINRVRIRRRESVTEDSVELSR
jgi:putative hemolysin